MIFLLLSNGAEELPNSLEVGYAATNAGEGAYSSVYIVRRLADGEQYALKKVRMVALSEK